MPTSWRDPRAWMIGAVGLALTASCASSPASDAPDEPLGAGLRVGPPSDLARVVRNAALAFRDEHGAYAGGGATFEARLDGAALSVTPRRLHDRGSPLSLETSLVARGETVLADERRPATTSLDRDGSIVLLRGEVAEKIQNDDAGVEQSWRFDHPPSGNGDLVVRVRATGQRYATRSDQGLHFGSAGSLGLRYGTGTWVDATGKRTVVTPRYSDGEIVMIVPDRTIAESTYPAVLDPTIAAEQEIDQPIGGSSAGGDQNTPSVVASGPGKGYFAVWFDRRGIRPALFGTRVATDGSVIDGTGIPIVSTVGGSTQPFVASSGAGYIVVWSVSYVDAYQQPGVYVMRLDADGKPLDPAPVPILANQTYTQTPAAAFDGTSWVITWSRYASGSTQNDIFAARIGVTGAVLDAKPIEIGNDAEGEYSPFIAYDGTDFFVTWRSYSAVYGQRFAKDLKPVGARVTLVPSVLGTTIYNVHSVFDGTRHVVVWSNFVGAASLDLFAQRFDKTGASLDPGPLSVAVDANNDDRARVVWDGTSAVIAWPRGTELLGTRMNTSGTMLDVPPVVFASSASSNYYDFQAASDGLGTLAVYGEYTATGGDVKAVRLAKPPIAGVTPVVLSKAANAETEPSVAWNGTNHYAAWLDSRDGRPGIFGARVGPDGQARAPVRLVTDVRYTSLSRPRIASDGSAFLMALSAYDNSTARRGIWALTIDANGQPAAAPFAITPNNPNVSDYGEPDVAFDGQNYLVTWPQLAADGRLIAALRLAKGTGLPLEKEPIRISPVTFDEQRTSPAVGFDGTNYLISWITSRRTASNLDVSHVYGARVSKGGNVLDGENVICDAFLLQRAPRVAGDRKKGGFFVVWEDFRTALETADVYGARIGAMGENLDGTSGMKIATGTHDESRPHVESAGDDSNWVVAWRDLRSKQSYDIYGAWVSLGGKNLDPAGRLLSAEGGDEEAPCLTASGGGKMLLAYERLDPRMGYGSYRIRARAIESGAPAAASCTKDEDCASRSCIDGVCCGMECGGCGVCNLPPGTCTPRAAGTEAPRCEHYKCKGAIECPNKCENDGDCASNASCDPATKTCVSRVICIDDHTLKDLAGKQTECAPFKCTGDACRTTCGSVDDCAAGFVCNFGGRCVQAPGSDEGGCALSAGSSPARSSSAALFALAMGVLAAAFARRRR